MIKMLRMSGIVWMPEIIKKYKKEYLTNFLSDGINIVSENNPGFTMHVFKIQQRLKTSWINLN